MEEKREGFIFFLVMVYLPHLPLLSEQEMLTLLYIY